MAEYSLKLNINGVDTAIASIEDLEKALKDTNAEMKTLQIGSEGFNAAAENAKVLQTELDKINEKTKGIDTKETAKSFAKLGEVVTGAFAVATSALSLFGEESEDVTKAQAQAQQALTLVLGARAIAEGVVEGAAAARLVVDKVSVVTTGIFNSLLGAQKVAMIQTAVATGTATAAQEALNIAMKATPWGIVATAVIGLATAIFDFGSEEEEAAKDTKILTEQLDRQTKAVDDYVEAIKEEYRVKVEIAKIRGEEVKAANLEKESLEQQLKARQDQANVLKYQLEQQIKQESELLNAQLADKTEKQDEYYLSQTDALTVFNQKNIDLNNQAYNEQKAKDDAALDERKKAFFDNADAMVSYLQNRIAFLGEDDEQKQALQKLVDSYKSASNEVTKLNNDIKISEEKATADRAKEYAKRKKDLEDFRKDNIDIIKDIQKETSDIYKQIEIDNLKSNKNRVDDYTAATLEIIKASDRERSTVIDNAIKQQEEIKQKYKDGIVSKTEYSNLLTENQKATDDKIKALDEKAKNDLKLKQKEFNRETLDIDLEFRRAQEDYLIQYEKEVAESDIRILESKSKNTERLKGILEYENFLTLGLTKTTADEKISVLISKLSEEEKAILNAKKSQIDKESSIALIGLQREIDDRSKALLQAFADGIISEQEYNKRREDLNSEYIARKDAIEAESRQRNKDADIAAAEEVQAKRLEIAGQIISGAQQVSSELSAINQAYTETQRQELNSQVNNTMDAAQSQIDAEKMKLEKGEIDQATYEKNVEAIKKQANDKKAKLEDDFNRKSFNRQKALAIVNAVIQTAGSVMQALGNLPPPASYIMAAISGALGAVQIALIAKQKYQSSADTTSSVDTSPPSIPSTAAGSGALTQGAASSGGFTGFTPNLTGAGGTTPGSTPTGSGGGQRVYVLESDITDTQNRVRTYESNATF